MIHSSPTSPVQVLSALRACAVFSFIALAAEAQGVVTLGSAESFAVLGGSKVADAGGSFLTGDIGVSPSAEITGIVPGVQNGGVLHLNDTLAMQAHTDTVTAYGALSGLTTTQVLTGTDLGTLTLAPGVYTFSSSAQLTGTLTLDGFGQANPQWVFQVGTSFTTGTGASVIGINGANGSNVFFQVGSSATLGTGTQLIGTIIADQSISATAGTTVAGRLLAIVGAVTLDNNVITAPIPETSSAALMVLGTAGVLSRRTRRAS